MKPTTEVLAALVSDVVSNPTEEQLETALQVGHAIVDGHCRGNSKTVGGDYRVGVGEIVLSVATRFIANPSGIQWRNQAGNFSISRGASSVGLTLAEQMVLQRYRKMSI